MAASPFPLSPLLPIAVSLIGGIVAGYYVPLGATPSLAALVVCLAVALLLRRRPRAQTVAIWLCTAVIGFHLSGLQLRRVRTLPRSHDLIIASEPEPRGDACAADALTADGQKIRLWLRGTESLHVGDGIHTQQDFRPVTRHPLYYYSHGYHALLFANPSDWTPKAVSLSGLSVLQRARLRLLRFRHRLTTRYQSAGLAGEHYAIVAAMTLGDKSALTPTLRDTYAATGASHVLALSGLHLSIIYWLLTLLAVSRRWRITFQVGTILAIWAFALLTGLPSSLVRAAVMLSVYTLLSIGHRTHTPVNALAFTAIVMLAVNPLSVFDLGFQLSFLAVLAILLFYPLLYGLLPLPFLQRHTLVRYLWATAMLSLAAQAGVAPLLAYYFHRFSTYFLLTNLLVIPGAYLILSGSLALLLSGSTLLVTVLSATIATGHQLLGLIARLPMATIEPLTPTLLQTGLLYFAIGCAYVALQRLRPN